MSSPEFRHEGLLDLPDVRLWYDDSGGGGEAVVLCHPASQGNRVFERQRTALVQAGLRVVSYARRGYFRSESGPADKPGTTTDDLLALMDALGLARAHLLGAAAGGITALAFAVAHARRVRSLVLAGTIIAPDEAKWRDMYARLGIASAFKSVPATYLELGPAYRASDPDGTQRFEMLSKEALASSPARQATGVRVTWASMEGLRIPVLLITGEADLYAPPPLLKLCAQHLHDGSLVTLREIGHAPYWEASQVFNDTVVAFLTAHGEATRS